MGKLVKFDLRPSAAKSPANTAHGDAQILIFTGVRYERGPLQSPDVSPDTRLDPTRPKRKRG